MDEHMSWCTGRHTDQDECEHVEEILDDIEIALVGVAQDNVALWLGDVELASVQEVDVVLGKLAEYRERLAASILETLSSD